jgi:hypothetical protein
MNALQEAIRWNNEGSRLLQMGRFVDAADVIRQAAAMIEPVLIYKTDGSLWLTLPLAIGVAGPAGPPQNSLAHQDFIQEDGSIYVCVRPILLPVNVEINTLNDLTSIFRSVSCCIGFNLALACHLYSIETGTSLSLGRALEMYQIVLTGLCMDTDDTHITDSMSSGMLQCVVLNNLSHIHSELCEHGYSIYCMDCIVDLIGKMQSQYDTEFLLFGESDGILLNLMARQYVKVAPAA